MPASGLPKRKSIRLRGYDYSQNGTYFITICTKDRELILGNFDVGAAAFSGPYVSLSPYGQIADQYIGNINEQYPGISVPVYCIMPNHIHLIIAIDAMKTGITGTNEPPRSVTPTVPKIINSLKSLATKEAGLPLWQRGYYEHIIRGERDYSDIWNYIETNPAKWAEDQYYM
jgi:REP element-mobilizing transposase RayT